MTSQPGQKTTAIHHNHKKRKDNHRNTGRTIDYYLGWPYRAYIKTAKNGNFCEKLPSENDFEAVLATFCYYDHGTKASEAVQKIAADQNEYRKCSLCVIIC